MCWTVGREGPVPREEALGRERGGAQRAGQFPEEALWPGTGEETTGSPGGEERGTVTGWGGSKKRGVETGSWRRS